MNRSLLLLLLLVSFLIGTLAYLPLGTALGLSGAGAHALRWSLASGTILDGYVQGVEINGQAYGDASLKLKPSALLAGALRYRVDWESDHGRGSGDLSTGLAGSYELQDFRVELDLAQLNQAALWIQQSGGHVQLSGTRVRFKHSECVEAQGTARSNVLERNREILGPGWSDMHGTLRCENGDLIVPLASENPAGTRFLAQLRVAPGRPGRFDARVSGIIPRELSFALPIAGFVPDGTSYVYTHETSVRSGPT